MRRAMRLREYDNSWFDPGRSMAWRAAWMFLGQPLLRTPLLPSSALRITLLRMFGAQIGSGVVVRSEVVVKYPWHLSIGDDCWIGERAWIDCLVAVELGNDVCVSQGVYLCTGNHDWSDPQFGLRLGSIRVDNGAWLGARSVLLPGCTVGAGAVLTAGSVASGVVPPFEIHGGNPATYVRNRTIRTVPMHVESAREQVAS